MSWSNEDRARAAERACERHAELTASTESDGREQLVDLLTNLRHLADREGWRWADVDEAAGRHHEAEAHRAALHPCGCTCGPVLCGRGSYGVRVECMECRAHGPTKPTRSEAMSAWNAQRRGEAGVTP